MPAYRGFERIELDAKHWVWIGQLPAPVRQHIDFDVAWRLHPTEYHRLVLYGRELETPRWHQAYGVDYAFSGNITRALPLAPTFAPLLAWAKATIDPRLNGVLVNWYDAAKGHYISKHRDSPKGLLTPSPIVTISLGGHRLFRLRPWKGSGRVDLAADDGRVFILPYETNRAWTHEVPRFRRDQGRRISVTMRCFEQVRKGQMPAV